MFQRIYLNSTELSNQIFGNSNKENVDKVDKMVKDYFSTFKRLEERLKNRKDRF